MSYIPRNNNHYSTFGELVTAEPTPIIQLANQYSLDPTAREDLETFSATGGSTDSSDNLFRCQTGTSVGGYGVIRSKDALVYRPGQAIESRFTGAFTTGIATSLQFAGMFSLTETLAFGYDGADFSIIHEYDGKAEVQLITVTATPSGSETATVTLDGDAVSVSLTNSTVQTNAFEIARDCAADATVGAKWRFEQIDDKVYCIAKSVGNKTGTMSFSSATATATIAEQTAGVAKSSGNVAQASWNITTTPFTGFDPTNLNLYRIQFGYLGVANATYSIFNPNTAQYVKVHTIKWAGNNTTPIVGNPDMKVGWTAASLGSSGTNLTTTGGSVYLAVQGKEVINNSSRAFDNTKAGISTTLTNVLTIKNRVVYGDRFNLSRLVPVEVSVDNDHNKGAIVEIYKNATLAGTPNYQYVDQTNSIALTDIAGTTVTGGTLVDSFTVAASGDSFEDLSKLKIILDPEDTLTVAVKTISGTATNHTASIVWLEEK